MDKKKKAQEDALRELASVSPVETMERPPVTPTLPQVVSAPLVTLPAPQAVSGPAYPKDAVYTGESADIRPVDLTHDQPYNDAALLAAKILMKEEGFIPKAKMDVTRPRVGYSTEEYETGKPVQQGDVVSEQQAYDMMMARVLRDQNTLEGHKLAEIMHDPKVEAVTLSRMYHQGPGNVLNTRKNGEIPLLFRALLSNNKKKFADAVKKARPEKEFKGRLKRESDTVLGKGYAK